MHPCTLVPPPRPHPSYGAGRPRRTPLTRTPCSAWTGGQINLDYAASAPCARAAADAVAELLPWYASVHRGAGRASPALHADAYERGPAAASRDFLGARADDT